MAASLSDFDFPLPPERIALRPAEPRDRARLLLQAGDGFEDRRADELPAILRPGDVLVFNDTRVIPARLEGVRRRDGSDVAVEALLHRRLAPDRWSAFVRPGKRLRPGDALALGPARDLPAAVEEKGEGGEVGLRFPDHAGAALDAAVAERGAMPLPPYIAGRRAADGRDRDDYQTVYAARDGSVAAPTAGLHFTPGLLARLAAAGVGSAFVTLHVGAGTFLPVKAERVEDHLMHAEWGEVSADAAASLASARQGGGRVVCVGTTSLRLLESALDAEGRVAPFAGETRLFIRPGAAPVRAADGLLTNFHLPRSTLLMLVAAFAGLERMRGGYAHALERGYRFYSYGDAGLWWREGARA